MKNERETADVSKLPSFLDCTIDDEEFLDAETLKVLRSTKVHSESERKFAENVLEKLKKDDCIKKGRL